MAEGIQKKRRFHLRSYPVVNRVPQLDTSLRYLDTRPPEVVEGLVRQESPAFDRSMPPGQVFRRRG